MLLAASSGSVAPFQSAGQNDLLVIIAAVIIGGTALEGGRGTVIGTLVGILLLGIIANGLVLENISSFWQPVVVGALLLIAIILDEVRRRAALKVVQLMAASAAGSPASRNGPPLIQTRGLTKHYGTIVASEGVDFDLGRARSSRSSATTAPGSRR